jgi:acetaldehyde dehydrogenase/alcohol dehydrogenase
LLPRSPDLPSRTRSSAVCHALAHAVGARFGIAHGRANGIILPHVLRYKASLPSKFMPAPSYTAYVAPEKYAQIAWSSGSAAGASRSVARLFDRVDKRLDTVEIPRSLAEAGVPRDEFEAVLPDLARTAFMDLSIRTNPRTSLVGKLLELLRSSYEGRPEENTSKGGI